MNIVTQDLRGLVQSPAAGVQRLIGCISDERLQAIRKALGIKNGKARVFSTDAVEHLEHLALLPSDMPEHISNEQVLEIDESDAGRLRAERLSKELTVKKRLSPEDTHDET